MADTPNAGLPLVPENVLDPAAGLNMALAVLDALVQTAVISMTTSAPPGSPADGDMYIVGASATGDWAGEENNLAYYIAEETRWEFYTAGTKIKIVLNNEDGALYIWNGAQWIAASGVPAVQPTSGLWQYNTNTTMADPGNGTIRTDDTPAASTTMAISVITRGGVDATRTLQTLSTGDVLFAQEKSNSANWGRYTITGAPTNNTTWFEIPVSYVAGGGTVTKSTDVVLWAQWAT